MTTKKPTFQLPAKLTIPKADKAVPRVRLFQLLDEACRKQVIWLSAPAGSGKTTLIASYLAARKIKPLWYQCDARDADPAAFFAYLRQAVGKLAPRKQEPLPLLTPEYGMGLQVFSLNFFEQLFARLHHPAVLVFDNFQDLPDSSPVHELIASLLPVLPENVLLIFVSRVDASQCFSRLAAQRSLTEIDAKTIALTYEEALEVGSQVAPAYDQKTIKVLNERANGWIAGLVLMLDGGETESLITSHTNLFNYFAAEMMQRSDTAIQEFLVKASLLPVMDSESTEKLTGNVHSKKILQELVRRNYFISCFPGENMRYEFHPLFRDFLRAELAERIGNKQLQALSLKAGNVLLEAGEHFAAIELFKSAAATDELITAVLANAESLVATGQFRTLSRWIDAIPERSRSESPWLLYWQGVCAMTVNLLEARGDFERGYEGFDRANDAVGIFLSWAGVAETFAVMWGDYCGMEPWLEKYQLQRNKHRGTLPPQLELRVQAAYFGSLMYLRPYDQECRDVAIKLNQMLDELNDYDVKIKLLASLALYYLWIGDFSLAVYTKERIDLILKEKVVSPLSRIYSTLGASNILWLLGETVECKRVQDDVMRFGESMGITFMFPLILAQGSYAYATEGDLDGMRKIIDKMQDWLLPERKLDRSHYEHLLGWYFVLKGEYVSGLKHHRQALELATETCAWVPSLLTRMGLAAALIRLEEYMEADDLLDEAQEYASQLKNSHLIYSIYILRAYMWHKRDSDEKCEKFLELGFQLGMDYGYLVPSSMDRRILSPLCAIALAKDIRADYAKTLIKKWALEPPDIAINSDLWPWPVKIYTMGSFSLLVDEQAVSLSGKTKTKVIDLLKAIVSLGSCDVPETRICDLLWPDAEGDMAKQNFKTTLHRLRKQVGQNALIVKDGKVSLNNKLVWVDCLGFEQKLCELENEHDGDALARQVEDVTSVYRDGYLPMEHSPWVLGMQERIRTRFLHAVQTAANRLIKLEMWNVASDCYRKALENDPLAERFYIGLMRCHHQLGQKAEGLAVYRRCQETLTNELQIAPSIETEQWHKTLRQS